MPDPDATGDRAHGKREGRFFHRCRDSRCFLSLHAFGGARLPAASLRPASRDAAHHASTVVKLLAERLREARPEVRIAVRADSGFRRSRLLAWCDRNGVDRLVGLARDARLAKRTEKGMAEKSSRFRRTGKKRRRLAGFACSTLKSRDRERRAASRLECGPKGSNPRHAAASLPRCGPRRPLRRPCRACGEMEDRIREQRLHPFADRASRRRWRPDRFRLLLSAPAHVLAGEIWRQARAGPSPHHPAADAGIGAVPVRSARNVRFRLAGSCPPEDRRLFAPAAARLKPGGPAPAFPAPVFLETPPG